MSILTLASASSAYRGYEYYTANKVLLFTKIGERQYRGIVSGSGDAKYDVFVDAEHPRKSKMYLSACKRTVHYLQAQGSHVFQGASR